MEEREKPDGQSPDSSTGQSQWPLKPGVLVQINKMNNINISQLSPDSTPFKIISVSKTSSLLKYRRNKSKVYARLRDLLGVGQNNRVPSGIKQGAGGVVTYKKIKPTPFIVETTISRKRKKPGDDALNPSSTGDKMRLGAAPPVGGSVDPANDHKGFYENLPFHGMQNPPNKPISVIAPFSQEAKRNITQSTKSLLPVTHSATFMPSHKIIQRHQSFHGFQNNQQILKYPSRFDGGDRNMSSLYLNSNGSTINKQEPFKFQSQNNFQPILNFNPFLLPNPFSIEQKPVQVTSRRQMNIRRTASGINISKKEIDKIDSEKRFASLEIKKHRCYSPTFYSMRCKKHAKKRPVVYALPKKVFGELKADDCKKIEKIPIPAPRCKKSSTSETVGNSPNNSSNDGSENLEGEVSVIQVQIHSPKESKSNISQDSINNVMKVEAMKALKNSPMLKVSPNFIKPKTESPKGALSLQIQAKRRNSCDNLNENSGSKENLSSVPQMPLLNPQTKWSASANNNNNNQQNFYTLTPHLKHVNVGLPPQYSATIPHQTLMPRALFNEQLPKSKSFSSKSKHKKHFQIPIQKCNSFKFQTAESYFQPIKNIHEENLMKNGYVSDYPESSNGYPYKRERAKQKTKGPLIIKRLDEYHENLQFPENSVKLQYPQPVIGRNIKKPNGVVYADLDMPKSNKNKKNLHESTTSSQNKSQKSKAKTEYATLTFNDIGQEIDV